MNFLEKQKEQERSEKERHLKYLKFFMRFEFSEVSCLELSVLNLEVVLFAREKFVL